MEESQKRRERLKAMRVEATANVVSPSSSSQQTLISTPLANPLLENQNSNTPSTANRFDFYTDPIAAYATNKPRSFTPRPHISGPRNPGMPPSGNHPHQFQNNYPPHPDMYHGGVPYCSPGPASSPMGMRSPYPVYQGSPNSNSSYPSPGPGYAHPSPGPGYAHPSPGPGYAYPSPGSDHGRGNFLNNSPSPGPGYAGGPYPVYQGSPDFRPPFPPQGRGQQFYNSPSPGSEGRGQWPNNSPSPGSESCPQGSGQCSNNSPGPGHGGYPQGRGHGGVPSHHIRREGRQSDGKRMSPSPRYSGGRGKGRGKGRDPLEWYKAMVGDPWKSLMPVIWKGLKENDARVYTTNQGSFQKTPSSKKPRVSNPDDAFNSKKGASLADYLAEAFDDATTV